MECAMPPLKEAGNRFYVISRPMTQGRHSIRIRAEPGTAYVIILFLYIRPTELSIR